MWVMPTGGHQIVAECVLLSRESCPCPSQAGISPAPYDPQRKGYKMNGFSKLLENLGRKPWTEVIVFVIVKNKDNFEISSVER